MSDMAENRRLLVAMANPIQDLAASTTAAGTTRSVGHEAIIAQPSTFLLPRGYNRTMVEVEMPLSPLDKDQQSGLVSDLRCPLPIPQKWQSTLASQLQ